MSASTASASVPTFAERRGSSVAGLAIGLLSALSFASSGSFMKPLMEQGWSIGATLLLRMGGAALILAPAIVLAIRRRPRFLVRYGPLIAVFGLTGVAGCQIFYFAALQRMPVAMALLIQYLAPVLLVALSWVRTRRTPSRLVLAGSALAIVGLVLVVDVAGASFDLVGTLLALAAAACTAAYFLIAEKAGDDIPPLALASGGLITGALVMGILVGTGLFAFTAPPVDVVLAGFAVPWYVPILWVIVVATAGGYAFGVRAGSMLGSRVASFVGLTEVLFAVLFAWIVISEVPTAMQAVGGALILGGVILVRSDPGEAAQEQTSSVPLVPAP